MAFGLLNSRTVIRRFGKALLVTTAVLVGGLTVGLAFVSFARKVDTFQRAGIDSERSGGALLVRAVEPGGPAEAAGLKPGDRILTADGRAASSVAQPDKTLARGEFPHALVIQRGESDIHQVLLGKPRLAIDWKISRPRPGR